ncbi:MAG: prenyltransferase/squalene oxidase repeat-containing protein, partial [Planctomycetota bacterium]
FDRDEQGGFWYQIGRNQPFMRSRTSFALTAAGVTALYGAGEYDAAEVRAGLAYLHNPRNRPDAWRMTGSFDYFYSHYYAVQAMYQAGGDHWKRWFPRVRDEILGGMNESGHWEDLVGPVYATAMATIILQIPYRYLPIFER